jgi:2-aminobenzoate-CoA ligase
VTLKTPLLPSAYTDTFARDGLPPFDQWPVLLLDGVHAYPPTLNAAQRLLDAAIAEGHGDRIAIVSPNANGGFRETSYHQLQHLADAFAHRLVDELEMVSGNRILLRGYNGPMLAAAWLGVLKAGGIAVTTMPMLRAKELRTVMQKARCRFAMCDERLKDELEHATADVDGFERTAYWGDTSAVTVDGLLAQPHRPFTSVATSSDDVCLIAFTSGTTGEPKGCVHFHRDVMAMCDAFSAQVLRPTPDDRCIGTPPLAFTFGLGGLLAFPMHARASVVLLESATPEVLLETIAATRATITFTAPTFYRLMALAINREPERFDTSSLRISVSAGESLPDATRTLWREATGIEMLDGIGATELIHIFVAAAGADVRTGAIGRAVPGYQVAIVDEHVEPVPPGQVGRLAVRGPTGCRYFRDDRQTSYVQRGWNLTGDAGTMDDDGYVYFKSRTDDLIISSGYNIGAPEVESAVLTHPAVAECAVVGVPDVDRGQCIKAFIVLKAGEQPSAELARAIQDHVKATIAPYKYPRLVEFRDTLPRTETGKLQRYRLKEQQ